jgi:hypothetical protein
LPTEESVSSPARPNAAKAAIAASAIPSRCERFDASTSEPLIWSATSFELATSAFGNFVWIAFCTPPTELEPLARTSTTLTTPVWPASFCRVFRGTYTSAVWPPRGGLTSPTTVNVVPFRSSFEPTFSFCPDLQLLPRHVGLREECLLRRDRRDEPAARDERRGDEADVGRARVDAADRVRRARDVGLRRVDELLDRLPGRHDRALEVADLGGQALLRRGGVEEAAGAAGAAAAGCCSNAAAESASTLVGAALARRRGTAVVAVGGGRLLEALLDPLPLRRGGLEPHEPAHGQPLAARLHLGDDLRNRPVLVNAAQHQPARDGADAVERGDLLRLALREGELRAGQEEVVHEVLARLAELREVGDRGLVGLQDLAVAAAAAEGPAEPAAGVLLGRERHRQVGADARERVERRLLGVVEPAESAEIAITSATPIESPSSVRIVRPLRRTSSLRR